MLISNDPETNERLCKPLAMLTPVEYDALVIETSLQNQIRRFQKQYNITIKSISIIDGHVKIEWGGKT